MFTVSVRNCSLAAAMTLMLIACGDEDGAPPADGDAAPYDDSSLVPDGFARRSAEVNGVRINYVIGGEGDAVVLLHGWPQSWYEWHEVMPGLSEAHQVIAPDLRGIGGSSSPEDGYEKDEMAEDIHQLIRGLGLERAHLVGHDIGGMVAHAYARNYPAEVTTLTIMDVPLPGVDPWSVVLSDPRAWHFGFHAAEPELAETLVEGHQEAYFRYFYDHLSYEAGAIDDKGLKAFAAAYGTRERLHAGFEWYRAFPADEAFIKSKMSTPLDMPVLVMGGEISLGQLLPLMAEGLKGAGVVRVETFAVPESGHWIAEEQPEIVEERLLSFFAQ